MTLIVLALALLAGGAVASLVTHRSWQVAHTIGFSSACAASFAGLLGSILLLRSPAPVSSFMRDFPVLGAWSVRPDGIAALFLLVTFGVAGAAAVFAIGYLNESTAGRLRLWLWPCFNVMVAAIATALLANSVLLFLIGWEALTLASWLLVISEYEKLESRKAAWLYFLASHAGTALLIAFFALNHRSAALLDVATSAPAWLVILPLLGFGIKAGIVPLHVWLPEAHPAAPSHVSAVMSGAMVSVGIYGMLRVLSSVAASVTMGTCLVLLGALSAVVGAIQALSARRVKRLLAYSTVENSGIMVLGLGTATLAAAAGYRGVAALALLSVLAHVLVHAAFKTALFLGAGVMQHEAHTGEIDELSGLAARIPRTAVALFVACATAVAAPPFGAFVSEFLLYFAAIRFLIVAPAQTAWLAIVVIVSLALSGACALAAFAKFYGTPFLGRNRNPSAPTHGEWRGAQSALLALAAICLLFGIAPRLLLWPAQQALNVSAASGDLRALLRVIARVDVVLALVFGISVALLAMTRRRVRREQTWNCGYTEPLPAAQYTGTSLVQPLTLLFFPTGAQQHDPFMKQVYRPLSLLIAQTAEKMRRIQHGQLHWYLLYVFAALAVALLLEFWGRA